MSNTQTLMMAGASADDAQLLTLVRSSFLSQPTTERLSWLNQIELGLDGYGGHHRETAARILAVVQALRSEPVA